MAAHRSPMDLARERVDALRAWLATREPAPVQLIETHISWVLLGSTCAYKLKKPVRTAFLDFSSLDARWRYCHEELRLNRRLAPDIYLDVVEVHEGADGTVAFDGDGPVVDAAVRMRRFPDGALWSERIRAGTLTAATIDAMAERLNDFHGSASVAADDSPFGSAEVIARVTRGLVESIDGLGSGWVQQADWPRIRAWITAQCASLAPVFESRRRAGRVREGHGDLHLANLLQWGEKSMAFDGIEFDDDLRWIDVIDDVAFTTMDLAAHGRADFAHRFVNAYLEASGDYEGVAVLRFYMVRRALVRAMVAAMARQQGSPDGDRLSTYLTAAARLSSNADPRLAITHGLPGSGKTFVSQGMLEAAGALRVRSDVERKRLFGLQPLQSSRDVPGGIYTAEATERTYARLLGVARLALDAGWPVIVDAASLRRSERARFASLAASLRVPIAIVDCRADLQVLRDRIERRQAGGGDASEADVSVLERLAAADEPVEPAEADAIIVADAAGAAPPWQLAHAWRAAVRLNPGG